MGQTYEHEILNFKNAAGVVYFTCDGSNSGKKKSKGAWKDGFHLVGLYDDEYAHPHEYCQGWWSGGRWHYCDDWRHHLNRDWNNILEDLEGNIQVAEIVAEEADLADPLQVVKVADLLYEYKTKAIAMGGTLCDRFHRARFKPYYSDPSCGGSDKCSNGYPPIEHFVQRMHSASLTIDGIAAKVIMTAGGLLGTGTTAEDLLEAVTGATVPRFHDPTSGEAGGQTPDHGSMIHDVPKSVGADWYASTMEGINAELEAIKAEAAAIAAQSGLAGGGGFGGPQLASFGSPATLGALALVGVGAFVLLNNKKSRR